MSSKLNFRKNGMTLSKIACALVAGLAVQTQVSAATFVDTLADTSMVTVEDVASYYIAVDNPAMSGGDANRFVRGEEADLSEDASLVYNITDLTDFEISAFHTPNNNEFGAVIATITVSGSVDGSEGSYVDIPVVNHDALLDAWNNWDGSAGVNAPTEGLLGWYRDTNADNVPDSQGTDWASFFTQGGEAWQLTPGLPAWVRTNVAYTPVDAAALASAGYNFLKVTMTGGHAVWADDIGQVTLEGTALITPVGEEVDVTSVTVTSADVITLRAGDTSQATVEVLPLNADDASVTWASSDEAVATVDASGLITAVAKGNATITVTANDGSGFADSISVNARLSREDARERHLKHLEFLRVQKHEKFVKHQKHVQYQKNLRAEKHEKHEKHLRHLAYLEYCERTGSCD